MNKTKWKKFVLPVAMLIIGVSAGFVGKAAADGSIHTYVGCSLPK